MRRTVILFLTGMVLVALVVAAATTITRMQGADEALEAIAYVALYCINMKYHTPQGYEVIHYGVDCYPWAQAVFAENEMSVTACFRNSGKDLTLLGNCMMEHELLPPGVERA